MVTLRMLALCAASTTALSCLLSKDAHAQEAYIAKNVITSPAQGHVYQGVPYTSVPFPVPVESSYANVSVSAKFTTTGTGPANTTVRRTISRNIELLDWNDITKEASNAKTVEYDRHDNFAVLFDASGQWSVSTQANITVSNSNPLWLPHQKDGFGYQVRATTTVIEHQYPYSMKSVSRGSGDDPHHEFFVVE